MQDINLILQKLTSEKGYSGILKEKITEYDRLQLPGENLLDSCICLKTDFKFDQLIDIVGVDRFTHTQRYEVIYNLWSNESKSRLFLRVKLDSNDPEVDSVSSVWSTADWQEREVFDMFGIKFKNHPDLRRIYMMDNFEYYPLRKDFPLTGIPGSTELPKNNH